MKLGGVIASGNGEIGLASLRTLSDDGMGPAQPPKDEIARVYVIDLKVSMDTI